tara:strand:- start:1993 stop:2220 length:228 start_codon:yes stop_codon:yes gene_type:complete
MSTKWIVTPEFPNGKEVNLTPEEETQLTKDREQGEREKVEYQTAFDNQQNLKASAKAKLIAGEPLTEDEADTIVL